MENLNSGKEVYYGFSSEASTGGITGRSPGISIFKARISPEDAGSSGRQCIYEFLYCKAWRSPFESKANIQLLYSHSEEAVMALPLAGE